MSGAVAGWLDGLPRREFYRVVSEGRAYETEEAAYDGRYGAAIPDPHPGARLLALLDAAGGLPDGPCVEIGCGTGHLTVGLAASGRFPLLLASDGSPAFLRLARDKLAAAGLAGARVDYAVLRDEDVGALPGGAFALVALRSALHHFTDYAGFFRAAARLVAPGGVVAMLEPRAAFFIQGALIVTHGLRASRPWRVPLSAAERARLELFLASARFYLGREGDRSAAEDKFAFHDDELLALGAREGLSVTLAPGEYEAPPSKELLDYLTYCMGDPPALTAKVARLAAEPLALLDALHGASPRTGAAAWTLFRRA